MPTSTTIEQMKTVCHSDIPPLLPAYEALDSNREIVQPEENDCESHGG